MQLIYLLGILASLCLSYQCAAKIQGTTSDKNTGAENANIETTKIGSKVPAAESPSLKSTRSEELNKEGTPTPMLPSDKKVTQASIQSSPSVSSEAVKAESIKIRSSNDSDHKEKSAKTPEAPKPTGKIDGAVGQIKPADDKDKPNQLKSPIHIDEVNDVTFKPSRILVMMPLPFYSHTQNYMPIFKELAQRGHHVTIVSPFPQNISLPNWEEIIVPNLLQRIMGTGPDKDMSKKSGIFHWINMLLTLAGKANRMALELEQIKELYNDDSRQFDLVMLETQCMLESFLAFGHKFKAPVISLHPLYIAPEVAYYTGNPVMTTTYVPNIFFPHSNSMSFVERAINTAFVALRILSYSIITIPEMDSLMREYLPSKDLPYVGDMLFNVSFTLIDSHHVLSYPYPRVNNIREFLGINTKPTSKLNEELQEYMDQSDDGVVFFTLGSHYQTSTLRPHILNSLLVAFSRIPNKVLMKWDKDEPPEGLPPNVKTGKWFPQSAILAHKNCAGFITHTGVHGLVESVDHAVPVISIPLFADQHFFAKWVVAHEVGRAIDIETVTPDIAYETITEVINNKKYKRNVIEMSKLMKDLPQPTLSEVIYWIEYVIRTKGAPLLRPGSLNLAWYQRFGLDLLAAVIVIISVLLWIILFILKCLLSMCCRNKTPAIKNADPTNKKPKKAKKED